MYEEFKQEVEGLTLNNRSKRPAAFYLSVKTPITLWYYWLIIVRLKRFTWLSVQDPVQVQEILVVFPSAIQQ